MSNKLALLVPAQYSMSNLEHLLVHLQKRFSVEIVLDSNVCHEQKHGIDRIYSHLALIYNRFLVFLLFTLSKKSFLNNFRLMLLFQLSNERNFLKKILFYGFAHINLPLITYDRYMSWVMPVHYGDLLKYDKYLVLTEFRNDALIKYLKKNNCLIVFYVYSWDHVYKFLRFSKSFNYLVWNSKLRSALLNSHGVTDCLVSGTSQFDYIFTDSDLISAKLHDVPYVYFCMSTGLESLVRRELEVIFELASCLKEKMINMVVRPYPLYKGNLLKDFTSPVIHDNVIFEEVNLSSSLALEKASMIANAICVIHCGSTIGIESFLLRTPSFLFVDTAESRDLVNLKNFALQEQNKIFYFEGSGRFVLNGVNDLNRIFNIDKDELNFTIEYFRENFTRFDSAVLDNFF